MIIFIEVQSDYPGVEPLASQFGVTGSTAEAVFNQPEGFEQTAFDQVNIQHPILRISLPNCV
jgi:hypothetical protein